MRESLFGLVTATFVWMSIKSALHTDIWDGRAWLYYATVMIAIEYVRYRGRP